MKKISRKILSMLLALTLCIGTSTINFAGVRVDGEQIIANKEANIVESIVGNDNINNKVSEKKNAFYFAGADTSIIVPKTGDQEVVIQNDMRMELPEVVKDARGVITSKGTVVYTSNTEEVAVTVQALQQRENGITFDSLRSMITIKNETAPSTYDFGFNLPEGYSLVQDYDYDDDYDEFDCGQIFILDENGEIVNTIDPAWAKDANGDNVKTHYIISGSTLTQVVDFDKNTQFPVVADPTSHPNKIETSYMTKAQVKATRDKFKTSIPAVGFEYLISTVLSFVKNMTLVGVAWGTITFAGTIYNTANFDTWDTIYTNFKKTYARIDATFKWHPGHRSYYPTGALKCTYVDKKA